MVNMGELFAHDRIGAIPMELVQLSEREAKDFALEPRDLLFARQSVVEAGAGKCSIVLDVRELTCFESHIIRVRLNPDRAIPEFFYYYFRTPIGRARVDSIVTGAAQKGIRGSELQELLVHCPMPKQQERLAQTLCRYDDLISSNRRRMTLLEESVHLLYREWFERLRFPGHEWTHVIDGVPEGWRRGRFADLVSLVNERLEPGKVEPIVPYVGLEHIPRRSLALQEWGAAADVTSTKLWFLQGDILFGKIRPYFHKVVVAPIDGITSSDALVFRAREERNFGLAVATAASDRFVEHSSSTGKIGTRMPRADWATIAEFPVLLPPDSLAQEFSEFVRDRTDLIGRLVLTNRKLREARDYLLPRLMSGQLTA
jgi:type I restriction enzyme S subunit